LVSHRERRLFTGIFNREDFTSSHLFVVLCTGLAFLAVQLVLSIRFYVRTRRQEKILERLYHDFKTPRVDSKVAPTQFGSSGWPSWVLANFATESASAPCNFTRDDALQELDARIASNGDYLLLQRLGVMAPLLGVVLTVIGFFWLEIREEEQSLQTILLAVAPLVSGVGTGAILALINQALLHIAGYRAESVRTAARKWFDAAIWSQVDRNARVAAGQAGSAMDQLTTSLGDACARYSQSAAHIGESTSSMSQAASQFQQFVHAFSAEMQGIPDALREVRSASAASADALQELIQIGNRAVANLDVSVAAFRTTIDREFTAAARLQHQSSQVAAQSAQQLDAATQRIQSGSRLYQETAQANRSSFEQLDESMRVHVMAGNQRFRDSIEALSGQVSAFDQEVATLKSVVETVASELHAMVSDLTPTIALLRDTKAVHETLAQAASNLTFAGNQLRQSTSSNAATSHRALDEVSTSLVELTKHFSQFVSTGLDPATRRLAMLHDTLAEFEAAVDAHNDFDDDDDLMQSPDDDDAETSSRGRFMAWLTRRPR
jgi:hypothetical protein